MSLSNLIDTAGVTRQSNFGSPTTEKPARQGGDKIFDTLTQWGAVAEDLYGVYGAATGNRSTAPTSAPKEPGTAAAPGGFFGLNLSEPLGKLVLALVVVGIGAFFYFRRKR